MLKAFLITAFALALLGVAFYVFVRMNVPEFESSLATRLLACSIVG